MEIDTINNYYVEGTKSDLERASLMIKTIREDIRIKRYNSKTEELDPIEVIDVAERLNFKIKTEVILYAVSDMSIPLTKRHDSMRGEYLATGEAKKIAQKKFLKAYYAIHKPYDRIKSACWKTLFTLAGLSEDGEELKK